MGQLNSIGIFYFSGTGNTAKVVDWMASFFEAQSVSVKRFNIEDFRPEGQTEGPSASEFARVAAMEATAACDAIIFAYPVQGSMAPMVVWQFVQDNKVLWQEKSGAVVVTQYFFSGDGAAYLARVLRKKGFKVVATEHFRMPNNITDVRLIKSWIKSDSDNAKLSNITKQRVELFAMDFIKGRHFRIGDHIWGILLGAIQRVPYGRLERRLAKNVKVDCRLCTRCGVCVQVCPTQNLTLGDAGVEQREKCTICYRCVNQCPEKAISILSKNKPQKQYRA